MDRTFIWILLHSLRLFISVCCLCSKCLTSNPSDVSCRVTKCDLHVTPEHGAQIALTQYFGVTETSCLQRLSMMSIPDYSGFYCADEKFCGLDLHLENTKELNFLSNKSCSVFVKSDDYCPAFAEKLISSGWQFFSQIHFWIFLELLSSS